MGASLVRLVGATHRSHGDFRVFSPDAGAAGSSSASSRVPCHHRGNGTWRTPCAAIRFLTSNERHQGESAFPERPTKGQVEARFAGERVMGFAQCVDAMEVQASGAAPHDNVAMIEAHPPRPDRARLAAPEKCRWHAQGNRNDRGSEVLFIPVLMECQSGAWLIAVDEARIGREPLEARSACGALGDARKRRAWPAKAVLSPDRSRRSDNRRGRSANRHRRSWSSRPTCAGRRPSSGAEMEPFARRPRWH